MKDIRIISGKRIVPSMETMCMLLGYQEYSDKQTEIEALYQELLPVAKMHVCPKAALTMENGYLYLMLTLGSGISRCIERYTKKGDMLLATVLDAMADSCLFAFEEQLLPIVRQIALVEGYGIEKRLEIPRDISVERQKEAYDILDAKRTLGLSMTNGYMLDPVKSMCLIFQLTKDITCENLSHNCESCENTKCALRKETRVLIKIEHSTEISQEYTEILCTKGSNLLETLQKNAIFLPADCGGKGICGKCSIFVKEGYLPITAEDRKCFSFKELQKGKRLACKAIIEENLTIALIHPNERAFVALGNRKADDIKVSAENRFQKGDYGIGIDIGTTTIAFSLLELETGKIVDTHTALNTQRQFGADVISRIQAANEGKADLLQQSIQKELWAGIKAVTEENKKVLIKPICHIAIAANTVMLHLVRGYACQGFCRYPFAPESLEMEEITLDSLLGKAGEELCWQNTILQENTKVTLLPGISAFVGADITAGIYACNMYQSEKNCLFIDLGTNGEIALKAKGKIYVTSTAAGPAFEGGNICWGMGSIAGAIVKVQIASGKALVWTIKNQPPEGICGTGVIESVAELLREDFLDASGKLKEPYFTEGYPLAETLQGEKILLTQADIRQVQMAKAAIRAGIEILLAEANVRVQEVEQVYVAGGFGYYLDIKKVSAIGMIPENLIEKTVIMGNTALKGTLQFLENTDANDIKEIVTNTEEIQLAQTEKFQELYLKYMSFEKMQKIT